MATATKSKKTTPKKKSTPSGTFDKLNQLTDEYVGKVMALYDSKDIGTGVIERIYYMRECLMSFPIRN